jgi:AbrB family looped-hinge helix DNA binding protein
MEPVYIKSFSKGQITIPKKLRDKLGLKHEFWMKVELKQNQIVLEPTVKKTSRKQYVQKLKRLKTDWFDYDEYKKIHQSWDTHITDLNQGGGDDSNR